MGSQNFIHATAIGNAAWLTRGVRVRKLMVQDLLVAASRRGISSLDQACGADARALVADVAGVAKLGATLTVAESERVRPLRNTLLAVLEHAAPTLDAGTRSADSSLILDLPAGQWTRCNA